MKKHGLIKLLCLTLVTLLVITSGVCLFVACDHSGEQKISVTFVLNDGTGRTETRGLSANEQPFIPSSSAGLEFIAWTTDEEGNHPYTALTDGLTLYAQWRVRKYTVNFYVEDELIGTQTVEHGESATLPDYSDYEYLIPDGYVLGKWEGGDYTRVTQNLNIFANCVPADCNVKFMDRVGTGAKEIAKYFGQTGNTVSLPSSPKKSGFEFAGWFKADGSQYTEQDTFEDGLVYFAHWTLVNPTVPSVSGNKEITYGDTLTLTSANASKFDFITYSYDWFNGEKPLSSQQQLSLNGLAAGAHTLTLKVTAHSDINGDEITAENSADVNITVLKATLTASAKDVNLTYGDAMPDNFEISYSGFKFEDDSSAINKVEIAETNYMSPVGVYYAVLSFDSENYNVKGTDGESEIAINLTVAKKPITVQYEHSKTYDGNALNISVSKTDGLIDGHILSVEAQTKGASAGNYAYPNGIVIKSYSVVDSINRNYAVTANYAITFDIKGNITGANLDYKIPTAVVYDGDAHVAEISVKQSCEVQYSLDNANFTAAAPSFTDAGTYRVYFRINAKNYFPVVGAYFDFVIDKAPVTIDIHDKMIVFGGDIPAFTYSIDGVTLDTPIDLVCGYAQGDSAGKYEITCDETHAIFSNDNYNISVNKGTLSVLEEGVQVPTVKPVLTINLAGERVITYGDEMPVYTISSVDGLIDGDTFESAVSGTMKIECEYTANPHAGVFALVISGLTSDKYEITVNATLTVEKALLTIYAGATSVRFGSPIPNFLYFAEGLKFNDTKEILGTVTFDTTYMQNMPATQDGYDVNVNLYQTSLDNYEITTVPAKLKVTKAITDIIVEKEIFELDYTGYAYDFKSVVNAMSTNFDENSTLVYDIQSGTDGGNYTVFITSPETENFAYKTISVLIKIRAAKIGHALYTVEEALEKGGNILLIGNAFISKNVTVQAGTTLTIPYREDGTLFAYGEYEFHSVSRYLDPLNENLLYTLTLTRLLTLTINGTVAIGGEIGQAGGAYQGHTTGMHSVIKTEERSKIIIKNGGTLDCMGGFIVGDGTLEVNDGGTLKQNFTVLDFRGGTCTVGSYQKGNIAPFNIFDVPNIQIEQTIRYGAKVVAHCDLYASGNHNTTDITVIDKSDALLNLGEKAYIVASHNVCYGDIAPRLTLSTYGNVTVGSIKLTIKMMITATVDMADVFCPLSYVLDLHVFGTLSTNNRFKLLPGASLTVEKGGSLNLLEGAGLTVYTGDWKDQMYVRTDGQPIVGERPEDSMCYPHDKGDATLLVKGTMTVSDGASIGGYIYGEDGAEVSIGNQITLTVTTKEGIAIKSDGILGTLNQVWHETAAITKTAELKNADGSTTAVEAGKTYTYYEDKFSEAQ